MDEKTISLENVANKKSLYPMCFVGENNNWFSTHPLCISIEQLNTLFSFAIKVFFLTG